MTIAIYCLSCIGLALANDYGLLLFLRMVQAFGASSLIAVGAGVVGDIAEPAR
jgi:MFS family permease